MSNKKCFESIWYPHLFLAEPAKTNLINCKRKKQAEQQQQQQKKQVFKNYAVNHLKIIDGEEWWQIYLGVLGKKGGNEEFVEKEFLRRWRKRRN